MCPPHIPKLRLYFQFPEVYLHSKARREPVVGWRGPVQITCASECRPRVDERRAQRKGEPVLHQQRKFPRHHRGRRNAVQHAIRLFEHSLRELEFVIQDVKLKRQMERQPGFDRSARNPSLWSGIVKKRVTVVKDDGLVLKILSKAQAADHTKRNRLRGYTGGTQQEEGKGLFSHSVSDGTSIAAVTNTPLRPPSLWKSRFFGCNTRPLRATRAGFACSGYSASG
jgi:hypothetical protein